MEATKIANHSNSRHKTYYFFQQKKPALFLRPVSDSSNLTKLTNYKTTLDLNLKYYIVNLNVFEVAALRKGPTLRWGHKQTATDLKAEED